MKAFFLIGGPGSGKAILVEEIFKNFNFKEYNSKQIKKESITEEIIVITENAYDLDSIISDKVIIESKGYETYLIYVDISENIFEKRTLHLVEEIKKNKFQTSKDNILNITNLFEGSYIIFNNDIDKNNNGNISKQIRNEEIEKVFNFVIRKTIILENKEEKIMKTNKPVIEVSSFRKKLQEYCPSCQLTNTELNPEKKSIKYNEEDEFYGNVNVEKNPSNNKKVSKFNKSASTNKSSNTGSVTNTTGSGIGAETALRYGGDSGSTFNMSGLGSVTYRESIQRFRNKLREAIDSPSVDSDMGYIGGGWGQSNKDEFQDIGLKYSTASGPKNKKIKKEDSDLKDACWKGYTAVGLKKKNGKIVPNCVPKEEVNEAIVYHLDNNIPLYENCFRFSSESYFEIYNVIRENKDLFDLFITEEDKEILESDLGTFAWFEEENKFVPLDFPIPDDLLFEEKSEPLNKPKRGGSKKFYVYVKTPNGNIKKVSFGDTTGLSVKFNDPERRKSFVARHNCASKNDKTTPGYWSCRLPRYAKSLGLSGGGSGFW